MTVINVSPASISKPLLAWYRANKRSLPWRDRQDDSYAVWVSEIMLQQTTVNAVIGFYNRWMARFPTLSSLAEADLDDVLKHWAGLGYYARARNLKAAAEDAVVRFGGTLPKTKTELLSLPGIGKYTAGAISSIAHQQDEPIVDANVIRVLCRVYALKGDPKTSTLLQKKLWELAEATIPAGEARDYNQALMELGALVCLPSTPACTKCPITRCCDALKTGDPGQFPEFGESKKWIEVQHASCFVQKDGKLLIVQRPLEQLWGGLWELPRVAVLPDENPANAAVRAMRETVGIAVTDPVLAGSIKHIVTNRRVTLSGYIAKWDGAGEPTVSTCRKFAWAAPEDLPLYAISSPQLELLERINLVGTL